MGNPARNTEHLVPWKPGQSGNPAGRPRGARSKLTEAVIAKLLASFEQHGDDAIERVRTLQPAAYLAACVSLLPKQQEKIESPFADLTEEELELLETFLRSQRAKPVTQIDADAIPQDARERADVTSFQAQDTGQSEGQSRGSKSEPSSAAVPPITRAAARKVFPQSLSDAEIEQRLDNALNNPDRR